MGRPPPPRKRSLWEFMGKPVVIVLSFILIIAVLFLILVYFTQQPYQYPGLAAPTGAFGMEYNSTTDTYRLSVISLSEETLDIDEIYFRFRNINIDLEHYLPAVLNNENSDVTFHDSDGDGLYSIGDDFHIDGDIVEPDTAFTVVWGTVGKVVMDYKF